jgi:glycosyltransferase involved in cell wall biosynthesis
MGFMWRLQRLVWRIQPDVLYGFMPTENLACLLASRFLRPRATLVWGIRASDVDVRVYGLLPKVVRALQKWLVHWPDLVISNSHAGLEHLGLRANRRHSIVIPNGIDTARFRRTEKLAQAGRALLQPQPGEKLVALIGRLDPMKGHECFLRAATLVSSACTNVRFVIVGSGPLEYRQTLSRVAAKLGISDRLTWRDAIAEIEIVYNAIDVLATSSIFGEGFPNVVAEALACGLPVVATDVGDTARVLGACGWLVPRNEPAALAAGILQALRSNDVKAAETRRDWIIDRFGVPALVRCTEEALLAARGQVARGTANNCDLDGHA